MFALYLQMEGVNSTNSNQTVAFRSIPPSIIEVSVDFFNIYTFVGNVIVTPVICILGLCCNGLGLFVLWNDCKYQKQSVYRYMFALMAFDNVYLLVGLVLGITSMIQTVDWFLANWILMHMVFVTGYFDVVIYHTSSILLMVMALERLNALVRPFHVKQSWLSKYPIKIICTIFGIIAVSVVPFPLSFEIVEITFMNATFYNLQTKPEFDKFYERYSLVETLVSSLYPFLMLIINVAIPITYCRVLHRRRLDLPHISSNDVQQFKITMMILWIAIMYILLAVPKILLQTLIFIDRNYDFDGYYSLTFYFLTFTGDILARLNAANDFFIYVLVSERYRRIIRLIFCRRCTGDEYYNSMSDIFRHASTKFSRSCSSYGNVNGRPKESKLSSQISIIGVEESYSNDQANRTC